MGGSEPKLPNYRLRIWILVIVFFIVLICSFMVGRYPVYPDELFRIIGNWIAHLFDPDVELLSGPSVTVLFQIRFPRAAAAMLIGSSLSLAGVSYQGMLRNPMVSPGILGATRGAGFGASLAIVLGMGYAMTSTLAFLMGLLAVTLAYLTSRFSHTNVMLAIVLAGMMISSIFESGTSLIKLYADTETKLPAITYWLMGSLSSIKPEDVQFIIWPILIGTVPLFLLRWRMNLLAIGEDEARSMGVNTTAMRLVIIVCATLITAASVSVSGMIGWVGLVIPHFCRMIYGYDYRRLVPTSCLFGATFLTVVDDIARISTTSEIPIGILTSFVGAPLFLYLILTGGVNREK